MSNPALEAVISRALPGTQARAVVRGYPALCRRAQEGGRPYERSFCPSCSRPKSSAAGRAPRAGCCAKRACPTSRRSIRWTGRCSKAWRNRCPAEQRPNQLPPRRREDRRREKGGLNPRTLIPLTQPGGSVLERRLAQD